MSRDERGEGKKIEDSGKWKERRVEGKPERETGKRTGAEVRKGRRRKGRERKMDWERGGRREEDGKEGKGRKRVEAE
ncbi:hypothetical protein Tco_0291390 [Tanacetum coccineum]